MLEKNKNKKQTRLGKKKGLSVPQLELFQALEMLKKQSMDTLASFCKMEEAEALDRFGEKDCRTLMACSL